MIALEENLRTVVGEISMPLGTFTRRMTVARLVDGRLVVFSAIALAEAEMRSLEAWGRPAFLVVPNERHRKDLAIWKARYPDIRVVAPPGARTKVAEVAVVDETSPDFGDPSVRFVVVAGTKDREAALVVTSPGGTTVVVNEVIWNVADRPGLGGLAFHAIGFTGDGPRIPKITAALSISDRPAFKSDLERWATIPDLRRIVVSHGDVIERDPAAVLRALAASL
ncbi:MAG TPA: hypothetical protein VHJ20_06970 [Polyangia bacterium]|nr:hypothetical protein [Polyangia bacterium]